MWVYNFWNARPLKFGRAKNVQISARFLTTFDFDRECLRTDRHFESRKKLDHLNLLSTWTCGAGQPHVGLCPILLVIFTLNVSTHLNLLFLNTTRKFSKADKPARYGVSYAFTSSPFSFHACHILPASKFQYSYFCILLIFYRHQWTACVRTECEYSPLVWRFLFG